MKNISGLDTDYFKKRMNRVVRDIELFTPEEFARETARMAVIANSDVLEDKEFSDWVCVNKQMPEDDQVVDIFDHNGVRVTDVRFSAEDDKNFARWVEESKSFDHLQREFTTTQIAFWMPTPRLPKDS
ncbi:hypothetical protein [Endozoicomonas ascidiicola]|uniref:hypothetical protein n=1 Tax=Endozoicomonas ascidiicola TaxID=1698521 RepID=UPI000830AA8E|nr:hypothetical protein [Endozoicomonas ascidiicola]